MVSTVDYGDGSGVVSLSLSGNTFALSNAYATEGVYSVVVTVSDDNSASGFSTIQIDVMHVFPTMPGLASPSQDLNGDSLADDVNGNGRLDFDDIVKFFKYMDSQEVQNNQDDFDFNGNGTVDMQDIVELFLLLVANVGG